MIPAIDTHLHIWNLEKNSYGWLKGNTSLLNRTYEIEEIIPELVPSGIESVVLVQADNHLEDTNYLLEIAERHSQITGVVGWLPLLNPEKTGRLLEEYTKNTYFKGVRHLIHDEPNPKWLLQEKVIESLKMLASKGLTYDVVGILPEHIRCVQEIGNKIPSLRMVLDHLNAPPIATGKLGEWGKEIRKASENPMLYAKISGLGLVIQKGMNWSDDDIEPYLEYILGLFSAERCFCGGDWPVALLAGTYHHTWKAYRSALAILLPESDQHKVLCENATSFYRL